MIDINTILTQALTAAVAEATAPLQQRIAALEAQLAQATPAPQVDAAAAADALNSQEWFWEKVSRYITNYSDITVDELHNIKQRLSDAEDRLDKITAEVTIPVDEAKMVEALSSQEWFWEKMSRYITASDARIQEVVEQALDAHLENANHLDEDDVNSLVEQGVDYHEENRTHGDEDDIEELVQKLLNGASIRISV